MVRLDTFNSGRGRLTRTPSVWTFSVTASTAWLRVDVSRTLAFWRTRESMMWKIVVLLPVPERAEVRQGGKRESGKAGERECSVTV